MRAFKSQPGRINGLQLRLDFCRAIDHGKIIPGDFLGHVLLLCDQFRFGPVLVSQGLGDTRTDSPSAVQRPVELQAKRALVGRLVHRAERFIAGLTHAGNKVQPRVVPGTSASHCGLCGGHRVTTRRHVGIVGVRIGQQVSQ